jgi:hypothetical protein
VKWFTGGVKPYRATAETSFEAVEALCVLAIHIGLFVHRVVFLSDATQKFLKIPINFIFEGHKALRFVRPSTTEDFCLKKS